MPADIVAYTDQMMAATRNPARWLLRLPIVRWLARRGESSWSPGVCAHYAARKIRIQRLVDEIDRPVLSTTRPVHTPHFASSTSRVR